MRRTINHRILGTRRLAIAATAGLALLAAGCGDDNALDEGVDAPPIVDDATDTPSPSPTSDVEPVEIELAALNDSGAGGTATVTPNEDGTVTVSVETSDVAPDLPHAQHIHIGGDNVCPSEDAAGDDEFISTPEGQPSYGEIRVSLTTEGEVDAGSGLAVERMPVADEDGEVSYERTFELPEDVTVDEVIDEGVIVQHGIADTSLGEDEEAYDGPDSPLMDGVAQEATLPALCGELGGADGDGESPEAGASPTDSESPEATEDTEDTEAGSSAKDRGSVEDESAQSGS